MSCSGITPYIPDAWEQDSASQRPGDVYVNDLKPLQEGEEKHVISVFVADEPGLINRVAGVFGRRGAQGMRAHRSIRWMPTVFVTPVGRRACAVATAMAPDPPFLTFSLFQAPTSSPWPSG